MSRLTLSGVKGPREEFESLSAVRDYLVELSKELTLSFNDIAKSFNYEKFSSSLPAYTIATLPSALNIGWLIYISDESGGATVAFSDGTNWRRMSDRAIVS